MLESGNSSRAPVTNTDADQYEHADQNADSNSDTDEHADQNADRESDGNTVTGSN
jgi:hypothetical protein